MWCLLSGLRASRSLPDIVYHNVTITVREIKQVCVYLIEDLCTSGECMILLALFSSSKGGHFMLAGLSRRLIVLAITLLLMPVVLLACNSSFNINGGGCHDDLPTPPSVPTATPGQRFRVGQHINVHNMYVVSLESAKITTLTTYSSKGTPSVSGPVLEVQLSKINLPGASPSDFAS